jgi:hypothetical protein
MASNLVLVVSMILCKTSHDWCSIKQSVWRLMRLGDEMQSRARSLRACAELGFTERMISRLFLHRMR